MLDSAAAGALVLGGGALVQAATRSAAATAAAFADNGRTRDSKEKAVGWVFLEIIAALAIAVAIVWWTMPKKPRAGDAVQRDDGEDKR
jgi:hypothetical protein